MRVSHDLVFGHILPPSLKRVEFLSLAATVADNDRICPTESVRPTEVRPTVAKRSRGVSISVGQC